MLKGSREAGEPGAEELGWLSAGGEKIQSEFCNNTCL